MPDWLAAIARITDARTRSISAENPDGAVAGGAQAMPGEDAHCTPAAARLGKGWKVRPCLRDIAPGQAVTLATVEGPGVVQHIWMTLQPRLARSLSLRVTYDDQPAPSIQAPLGDFFANGIDGLARVTSLLIAVNPRGGLNCYWPMPFRSRFRLDVTNTGDEPIPELFYQVTWSQQTVPDDVAHLHATARDATVDPSRPEHVILERVAGRGHYVGTYLAWTQRTPGWWGEGEVKFFIDGDPDDAPTICGTGTEDYFGGAWGFESGEPANPRPQTFSGPLLGYPQFVPGDHDNGLPAQHGLYRWHLPDPIRFRRDLKVTIQALGWQPDGTYLPLADDIRSVAWWYQAISGES
ncbi:MAG: glycoside hydrolase family 172 protein [Planctomycetota bacterium]|jgi:hypothetical protein